MKRKIIIWCLAAFLLLCGGCTVPNQVKTETQTALSELLPKEANTRVTSSFNNLIVSVHLLKAYPPSDDNPYVKGNYWTKKSMQELIENSSAEIYKKIFTSVEIPRDINVRINSRHGVRVTYIGAYSGTSDQAMTIYSTEISSGKAAKYDWKSLSIEEIKKMWKVRTNIIPSLQFRSAMY